MEIAVTGRLAARNNMGQFIAACEKAATATVEDAIDRGEKLSKNFAPTGHKVDRRTVTLEAGMFKEMLSSTQGRWGNFARHALPIELGAGAHAIMGNPFLHFYWDAAGRWWVPGLHGSPDVVQHPGNAAQPYLKPAFDIIKGELASIAAQNYPG